MKKSLLVLMIVLFTVIVKAGSPIQPYILNNNYWEYKGEPIVLLGTSEVDNLFQLAGDIDWMKNHLDEIKSVGANYVRCTMSSRSYPRGGNEWKKIVWNEHPHAFKKLENGKYDLNQWNEEFWERLHVLLEETYKRDIIVQVDLWDAWNLDNSDNPEQRWNLQPWNPDNNINYTYENTCCEKEFGFINNPFFKAVPELHNDEILLKYQKMYIEKIVEMCAKYPNVLFQIDNESPWDFRIADYWARFVRERVEKEFGKVAYVVDSRRFRYPSLETGIGEYPYLEFKDWTNPEIRIPIITIYKEDYLYNFSDISQNQGNSGQYQYDNLIWYKQKTALFKTRPMNSVKAYWWIWTTGQPDFGEKETYEERVGKMWRFIFAGGAAIRYHRMRKEQPWQNFVVESARMLVDDMNIFKMIPCNELLSSREEDEAYCLAEVENQYAVYFTGNNGNSVELDLTNIKGDFTQKWLDIKNSKWQPETTIASGKKHTLNSPDIGAWVVLLEKQTTE